MKLSAVAALVQDHIEETFSYAAAGFRDFELVRC